ncbi:MAG: ester cyclase [Anaerolineae bacterium]|nr:ester cyclase [Anaerolineae bacterium]MCB0197104.1 ester cyclase [Anaerolineae bacterium]
MSEANKTLLRRVYGEIWNQGKLDIIDALIAVDYEGHYLNPDLPAGREGFRQYVKMIRAGFPDAHFTIEDMLAAGDKVVTRYTVRGTHQGALMGIPPTGRAIEATGIGISRIANGQLVESWAEYDQLKILTQVGVVSPLGEGV